ncbi:peptide ligase PGM1-related protein [Streptomyces griseoaurantiacus]|uniref:preATP grasp domain-containing protein n=1 Tax=Streptomyces TaxID=1883 RepID=UPI0029B8C50A|nr:peptide ligase PGM1-related protein [Streptomyces sp. ME02-6978.2a]MDX3360608.1 peptide ligase PGM1-related protein [Streptomyces sp. ME02-6978.2a]
MVKILVGNDFDEVLRTRPASGWWNQRVTWFAEDGDLVILPARPEESFLRYVTGMTGTRRSSLCVLVPPAEEGRPDTLSGSCLVDEEFLGRIRSALAGRPVTGIVPLWPSASIARLARALGVPEALAGREFAEQGGGALLNSKTAFRAIAAGVGVGLPCGRVCADRDGTVDAVLELVGAGHIAMLKKDYMSGGAGNEIVSPVPGVSPVGAKNVVVAADEAAVVRYVEDRWDWLTDGGRHQFVVERYHPGSVACFAEFLITDDGIEFGAHGEMLSEPVTTKQIIPPPAFSGQVLDDLTDQGRRLCEPLRAMGYRGRLSADAIVTPDGELLFTEYNGRITGSTHVYSVFGEKIVGGDFMKDRVLFEGFWPKGWSVPSFDEAVRRLTEAGLVYDRGSRTGVIISSAFDRRDDTLLHCVVAESLSEARTVEERLAGLFAAR